MLGDSMRFPSSVGATVLKILAGIGIAVVTVSMILFFNDILEDASPSVFLQAMVAGAIIVMMAFLSKKVFSEWTE